ncbi:hypothetical protein ACFUTX_12270 [Microbacterium sp. NPDC057407]|uniref:hypothetical protein n=1 Tax=Microbacterium sp. NPDC057407 TaxID=3346120 RepID=UPI00367362A1
MLAPSQTETHRHPELVWVGSGAWVACDPAVAEHDPHRIVAYLECKDARVYLLWVGNPDGVHEFDTIRTALEAVSQRLEPLAA